MAEVRVEFAWSILADGSLIVSPEHRAEAERRLALHRVRPVASARAGEWLVRVGDLDSAGVECVMTVYARDAERAAVKARQFLRVRVPVAIVEGPGVELVVYMAPERVGASEFGRVDS